MRSAVALLLVGCAREPQRVVADHAAIDGFPGAQAAAQDEAEADVGNEQPVVHAPKRARMAGIHLTKPQHGIDGTFELWRDATVDDETLARTWFTAAFDAREGMPRSPPPATAQLVVRDAVGRIVESLDLNVPLARIRETRLGDDAIPYIEVEADTHHGIDRWGAITTSFVRVERGHSVWLPCKVYECALACGYLYDQRPSGGFDLLYARQEYDGTTSYTRFAIAGGKCLASRRTEPRWTGDWITIDASSFPPQVP